MVRSRLSNMPYYIARPTFPLYSPQSQPYKTISTTPMKPSSKKRKGRLEKEEEQEEKADHQACVIPRPIGWISTISPATPDGPTPTANLAPYSQFQNLTFDPPYVMFSANQTPDNTSKDSVRNAELTGVFCWQLATFELREAVNITSEQVAYGVDEFERARLTKTWSRALKTSVPMVEESPVRFECEYHSTIRLPGNPPMGSVDIIIGRVVGVHIRGNVLTDGKLDVRKTAPIARCGYYEYAVIRDTFEMTMPGSQIMRDGLEGSAKKNREAAIKSLEKSDGTENSM